MFDLKVQISKCSHTVNLLRKEEEEEEVGQMRGKSITHVIHLCPGIQGGKEDGFNNRPTLAKGQRTLEEERGSIQGDDREGDKRDRSQKNRVKQTADGRAQAAVWLFPPLSAGERLIITSAHICPNVPVGGDAVGSPGKTRVGVLFQVRGCDLQTGEHSNLGP